MKLEDVGGEMVELGHKINRLVLYKMITTHYGIRFTECVLARMCQILCHFNEYKRKCRSDKIAVLQKTIIGLGEDMQELAMKVSKTSLEDNPILESSYNSNRISNVSSGLIMDEKEYSDELTIIHHTIESSINRVDGRISDINIKLLDITNKIDELVGSITLNTEDNTNINNCRRCSLLSPPQGTNVQEFSDPIFNHVHSIFAEYNDTNNRKSFVNYEECL